MFSTGEFWKTQRRFTLHHFRNLGFGKRTHQDLILEEVDELIKAITAQEGPFDIQVVTKKLFEIAKKNTHRLT